MSEQRARRQQQRQKPSAASRPRPPASSRSANGPSVRSTRSWHNRASLEKKPSGPHRRAEPPTLRLRVAVETASKQVPTAFPRSVAEALADSRRNPEESTAKARHQRERGAAKQTADLGR